VSAGEPFFHIGGDLLHLDNWLLIIPLAALLSAALVARLRRRGVTQSSAATELVLSRPSVRLVFATLVLVLIQTGHMAEHLAQVTQKFTLALKPAHGLVGAADLEWVHVFYNSAVLIAMAVLFVGAGFHRRGSWPWTRPVLVYVFGATLALQSYHMVEHVVKIRQHIETGIQGTPGILGPFFDIALLHYYLNVIVYLPIVLVFLGYGMHHDVSAWLFRKNQEWPTGPRQPYVRMPVNAPRSAQTVSMVPDSRSD
jgi:hypothetical protein